MTDKILLIIIIIVWNFVVFFLFGIDKKKAISKQYRISEKVLIANAFLFGGIGAFLGMEFFHHKTKDVKFKVLVPIAIVVNIILFLVLWTYGV